MGYQRDRTTWVVFSCLFGFGILNSALGPALPYLRASLDISYLTAAAHQVGYAVGGGLAGLLTAALSRRLSRRRGIAAGMVVAAVAGLGIGYGTTPVVTIGAALLVSLAGTSALIRVWALLADLHREHRTVAMSEGEVWVSLAGIATPLLIGGLAATALSWRSVFVVAAVAAVASALAVALTRLSLPEEVPAPPVAAGHWRQAMLLVVAVVVALEFSLAFWLASYLDDDVGLGRDQAVVMVSLLYVAALAGRLLVSGLARRVGDERLLAGAFVLSLLGAPFLLLAQGPAVAVVGILVVGTGTGATFPLTSSLHVHRSGLGADQAVGQVLAVAALGQIAGPLAVGVVAELADLRWGLVVAPALCVAGLLVLTRSRVR